ncbi:hypothetical protein E9993_03180 [Labilibacter sediminis]|nr:hypothetical protein E9993_03180 [Labilibacter sediminis]
MNKLTKITFIAMLAIGLLSFAKAGKWFQFESSEFGFKIEFPKEPTSNPQVINSAIGELKMNMFMYHASSNGKDDNLVYLANYTEYPDSLVNSENTETLPTFFRNSIDGAVTNVHGKLLSEKNIAIDEYPGREVRIDFQQGKAVITMRIFLVKNKMYMLQTITATNKDFNKSITQFMDSFKLLTQE